MKYKPFARIELDLTNAFEELTKLITIISLAEPGKQYEFFKRLDVWIGEVLTQIEEAKKKIENQRKEGEHGTAE